MYGVLGREYDHMEGGGRNLGGIEVITVKSHKDPLAKGIWPNMPTKYSIILWRIKNRQIKTLQMINAWEVQIQATCLLCGKEPETISHLFINCEFSRFLLIIFQNF